MFLRSIARAVPPNAYTQQDCWDILRGSKALDHLRPRSRQVLERVLLGDSGIAKRHFATEDVDRLFTLDASSLNRAFQENGTALALEAVDRALDGAGICASELDALLLCTCTGYLCPGLSSYVGERLGVSQHAYLQDLVGLGCGASIPLLRSAQGFLAANPGATVACVAVEICSAAFYLDDDPGVLISACLFGDGASATIWSDDARPDAYRIHAFDTLHKPDDRELLRFVNANGKLRNQLHRSVPEKAARAVAELKARSGLNGDAVIASHTGGRDVLDAIEAELKSRPLEASRRVLRDYGNTSSPAVLFVLEDVLNGTAPPEEIWLTSFGAGFAAHSCRLSRYQGDKPAPRPWPGESLRPG